MNIAGVLVYARLAEILTECFIISTGLIKTSQLFHLSNLPRYIPKLAKKQIKKILSSESQKLK